MSEFSAQWLQLREPLDAASRAPGLCAFLTDGLEGKRRAESRISILDLGAGMGANLRYAAPLLGGGQDWLLVERDPQLLAALDQRLKEWVPPFECNVRCLELDLATQLRELPLAEGVLIAASALLDLVSETWLRALALRAAAARAMIWFALTYDGQVEFFPAEPEDSEVRDLVNRHQLGNKGFGPALGPQAGRMAQTIFAQQGYRIRAASSDWHVGPQLRAVQQALLQGWCDAASESAPHRATALRDWLARRRVHLEHGRSSLQVGHVDIIGLPGGPCA